MHKIVLFLFLGIAAFLFADMAGADDNGAGDYQNALESTFRYSYVYDGPKIVERGIFATPVPRFAQIQKDKDQFKTYPQFLDYLFKQAPSLKRHFVLVHHSESLQTSSFEHPRVLLFDGGVAYGISEHPANKRKTIEMWETDPTTYRLHLNEIEFKDSGVEFHENPKACVVCHGANPKPLWNPYDFWPNAFGSAIGQNSTRQEAAAYERLKHNAASSPLLSRLQMLAKTDLGSEENTPFTQYIAEIGFAHWTHENLQKDLGGFKYPLLGVLSACSFVSPSESEADRRAQLLSFFKPSERAGVASRLEKILADVTSAKNHFDAYQDKMLNDEFPNATFTFKIDHSRLAQENVLVAHLRLLLDAIGVDASNLSPSLIANDDVLSTPGFFLLDMLNALYEQRPELFEGLEITPVDFSVGRTGWITLNCDDLKARSQKAERDWTIPSQWKSFHEMSTVRPVLSRCAKCHAEGMNASAPFIPFGDSTALAARLRDTKERLADKILNRVESIGFNQMPPSVRLTDQEVEAMKAFLSNLGTAER